MTVSFIIPVYGYLKLTKRCIKSLVETVHGIDYEILVIDDASNKKTKKGLQEIKHDNLKVVSNSVNCGYAYSNNLGASEAKGDILFLLNNDLTLLPNWIEPMLAAFQRFSNLGIVGNVQLVANTENIDHTGISLGLDGQFNHNRAPNKGIFGTPKYSTALAVTGACCAIRREIFIRHGGFNEIYKNGSEDVDLCLRLRESGYKVIVANKSIIRHKVSSTRPKKSLRNEINSCFLQKRWEDQLSEQAAQNWPHSYISGLRKKPQLFDWHLFRQAFPKWITRSSHSTPIGVKIATANLEKHKRHWLRILEGQSDDMIKHNEGKAHANWLNEKFDYNGLFENPGQNEGLWIREKGKIQIPKGIVANKLIIFGHIASENLDHPEEHGALGLKVKINESDVRVFYPIETGDFQVVFEAPPISASVSSTIELELLGVWKTNLKAYFGRKLSKWKFVPKSTKSNLGRYRTQRKNKRLSISRIAIDGETLLDFKGTPSSPLIFDFARKYGNIGINLVGWFKAQLGIGESVRIAAKTLKSVGIKTAYVPLKLNCLANQGDTSIDAELTEDNPYPINVFHLDAAQSSEIDHHHGASFRKNKYNIAYWAWELAEFPDAWIRNFEYFDEIWTPSHFVREAIAMKSPLPVITVPHSIDFKVPHKPNRGKFNLPSDKFLFSFVYDLNSYQERKNPLAVIEAFEKAFNDTDLRNDVGLVIKTHSSNRNPEALQQLNDRLKNVENHYVIDKSLARDDVYSLMYSTDSYVSLHRAEGFGLTVAESMFMRKPVISTNWSATTEFLNEGNGCPVNFQLVELNSNIGPYPKGQLWAEPDTNHAAEHMLKLVKDSDYARNLGHNAGVMIRERFSPELVGNFVDKRLKSIALW